MRRIMIIGCPGSGKSTLSKLLSKKLGLPVIHLDRLFWKEGWVQVSCEEFDEKLTEELQKSEWIIDGNYSRTIELRLNRADTVIFLDYPTPLCLYRVIKRIVFNFGRVRSDMGNDCPERFDWEFIRYVISFKKQNQGKIVKKLEQASNIKIITVTNKKEYQTLLEELC